MKKVILLSIALGSGLALSTGLAADPPRGSLLELHSCELFAGGCVVSSQATLEGRYMLRAWDFTGGSFAGADLTGLQLGSRAASLICKPPISRAGLLHCGSRRKVPTVPFAQATRLP